MTQNDDDDLNGATEIFLRRWPLFKEAIKKEMNLMFDEIEKKNWLAVGYLTDTHGMRTEKLAQMIGIVIEENFGLGAKTEEHEHIQGGYL